MPIDFFTPQLQNKFNDSISLNSQDFYQLKSEEFVCQYPILFTRIVYYSSLSKSDEEVISYAENQQKFSQKQLAYLKSEKWLTAYPCAFTLNELSLKEFSGISYICFTGYKNRRSQYIQIIAAEPLSQNLQNYIILSAVQISKYENLEIENIQQKSEIKMLEEVLNKVIHQVRNSLASIELYAHNLCLGLKNTLFQEQAVIIQESIENLDNNLTQLMSCGKSVKLRVTPQDLRSLLAESIKDLQPLIAERQLKILIPDTSTTLSMDHLQMKQVFDNLLSNAVYFSPHLGTITCSWQIFQGEVLIKISDQGPGLSQEDMKKIFTPFYSRRLGGTGLGLTIAKKVILDHQGSIWGQNLSGCGSEFCLILPRTINIQRL